MKSTSSSELYYVMYLCKCAWLCPITATKWITIFSKRWTISPTFTFQKGAHLVSLCRCFEASPCVIMYLLWVTKRGRNGCQVPKWFRVKMSKLWRFFLPYISMYITACAFLQAWHKRRHFKIPYFGPKVSQVPFKVFNFWPPVLKILQIH